MSEEEKLFYSIGEAAQMLDLKPYVLRYWETEFRKLNPQKSPTGQRAYRTRDLQVGLTIKRLLYGEKYTIAGAIQKLQELDARNALDPLPGTKAPSQTRLKPSFSEVTLQVESSVGEEVPEKRENPKQKVEELFKLIETTKDILAKYPILR